MHSSDWSEGGRISQLKQWRLLSCQSRNDLEPASCSIKLLETERDEHPRNVTWNPCHQEAIDGKDRTYCNLLCPQADTVYLIKRSPNNHRRCFGSITYKIEKRETDFYMWTEKKCRTSDVEFLVRCEFAFPHSHFPKDDVIVSNAKKLKKF
ncbi:unnamed protein product [Auanema sp. JU1783]|nr:unnamed protein product [Auanema sp. JU1783]